MEKILRCILQNQSELFMSKWRKKRPIFYLPFRKTYKGHELDTILHNFPLFFLIEHEYSIISHHSTSNDLLKQLHFDMISIRKKCCRRDYLQNVLVFRNELKNRLILIEHSGIVRQNVSQVIKSLVFFPSEFLIMFDGSENAFCFDRTCLRVLFLV